MEICPKHYVDALLNSGFGLLVTVLPSINESDLELSFQTLKLAKAAGKIVCDPDVVQWRQQCQPVIGDDRKAAVRISVIQRSTQIAESSFDRVKIATQDFNAVRTAGGFQKINAPSSKIIYKKAITKSAVEAHQDGYSAAKSKRVDSTLHWRTAAEVGRWSLSLPKHTFPKNTVLVRINRSWITILACASNKIVGHYYTKGIQRRHLFPFHFLPTSVSRIWVLHTDQDLGVRID